MKNQTKAQLWVGIAAGLTLWSVQELTQFALNASSLHQYLVLGIQGLLLGGFLGALYLGSEGYLHQHLPRMVMGIRLGFLTGGLGGMLGYLLVAQILLQNPELSSMSRALVFSQSWLLTYLMIGVGQGLRDQSNLQLIRGLLTALIACIYTGILFALIELLPIPQGIKPGLSIFLLGFGFAVIVNFFSNFRRVEWLKSLNGNLENMEFELSKHIHYLGTQNLDRINLSSYPNINSTHAKLIKYYSGYSILDNDPFVRTWVNFRNVTEQPLKNGDIIKVGTAVFQYLKA